MASILEQSGAQPNKQPRYVPIFLDRSFTGLFTQRAVLHDPSDVVTAKYYGGRPDALWQGQNVELTNRLTLQRRPGFTVFSTAQYLTPPLCAFSFQHSDGTIQVIVDTASAVYIDTQGGIPTKILLWTKAAGAGQTHFVAVAGTLYAGDGVETHQYTPGNPNGLVWNWGIVAPTTAPTITTVESGAAGIFWKASTVWSTLGLVDDVANTAVYQLQSVDMGGVTPNNTTQFGTSGSGQPTWAGPGGSTTDNSCTWVNDGPIVAWTKATVYGATNAGGGTNVNPAVIYDPVTKSIYVNISGGLATSGNNVPQFKAGSGQTTGDGGCKWLWAGSCAEGGTITTWQLGHTYPAGAAGQSNQFSACIEPTSLINGLPTAVGSTPAVVVYYQFCGLGGISSSTPTSPFSSTTDVEQTHTSDGDLDWMALGQYTWGATSPYIAWTNNGQAFSVVKVTVGGTDYWQVCTTGGTSGTIIPGTPYTITQATNNSDGTVTYTITGAVSPLIPVSTTAEPSAVTVSGFVNAGNNSLNGVINTPFPVVSCTVVSTTTYLKVLNPNGVTESKSGCTGIYNAWGTVYGNVTNDGTVVWTCVGKTVNWVFSTQWYLPQAGFIPPSSSSPYGGAAIIDSKNNVEFTISSGLGGSSAPSWKTVNNGTPTQSDTTDNNATWFNLEPFTGNSLAWSKGYIYAYSYKARALDDYYSEVDPTTGAIPIPPGLVNALPAPTGSLTETISTASPTDTITGANAGAINYVMVVGSLDPQVDTIVIWRTPDGGGPEDLYELTEIPNPPPVNGQPGTATFADYLPDTATNLYPGLNTAIPAPIADSNNPPYSSFLPQVYNFERVWGTDGEYVLASGGPDVLTGNPNDAFNPEDEWPFLAPVIRLVKTAQGLVTYLTNSIQVLAGGPATDSFYSVEWASGIGLLSYNALDVLGGEQYFFSADNQFRVMTPSLQIANAGFPLGDQFANMPSSGVSDTTWNPADVYVAVLQNGTDNCVFVADGSTGWYRLNPNQAPQGNAVWSPFASITGGCGMVQTIEVSPGIKRLLVGSAFSGYYRIMERNQTVFTDMGSQYDAYFVMGSITLAHPGQIALLKFLEFDFSGSNYQPTVSYLLNATSGAFTPFTALPVFDPPVFYGGRNIVPSSYSPLRYYFATNQALARCRHLQIKVDLGTTSNGDELFDMTIFGRLLVET
jgi:hypothetical protein